MRRVLIPGIILFSACAASVTDQQAKSEPSSPAEMQRMDEATLERRIVGHVVVVSRSGETREPHITETYCNGRVTIAGARVPLHGTYAIRDGEFCTTLEGDIAHCAQVYVSRAGAVYRQYEGAPVVPLEIVETDC
jgi:hypothetical protein